MSELVDVVVRELVRRPDVIAELAAALVPELERHGLAPAAKDVHEWLPLAEAGRRLGVSGDAVRMHANRGRLRSKRLGRRRYVSAVDVSALGAPGATLLSSDEKRPRRGRNRPGP